MRMLVIGTGPIGGIIGERLARAGEDVTFVDVDPEHVAAIRENGLRVDVPDGAFDVRAKIVFPGEVEGTYDTAFIAVRSNYTPAALATALPHLAPNGLLVSLQNGINPPLLEEKVGPDRTVGVGIRMGCQRIAPGHVRTANRGHLYIGHPDGKTTPQLEALNRTLDAVIPCEISDNIIGVLWGKLTYTCLGYFGSLADASLLEICDSEINRRTLVRFFAEVVAVGMASGIRFIPLKEYDPTHLHPDRPFERRLAVVTAVARAVKTDDRKGPLRQIQHGMATEVDYTLAHVAREGERLGIPTPLCRKVVEMVHQLEARTRKLGMPNYEELAVA